MRSLQLLASPAAALTLAACAIGPNYQAPDQHLTQTFHAAPAAPASQPLPLKTWWTAFGDPELDRIVERVRGQNLELAEASARIGQSRAAAKAAGAALLPSVSAVGDASSVRQSLQTPIGEIGHGLPGFKRDYNLYEAGAAASWEIDLFGGLRRQHEAARAEAGAAADRAEAVRVAVTAEAADAYMAVRGLQARLDVARRQEGVQKDLADLLHRQVDQGVAPERELNEAEAALAHVRAGIPPLITALEAEFNRLDVLMGAQPGTWGAELQAPAAIPAPPALATADGPAALLRRRPDVLAAEQTLIASNARIGAALSDYYPKLSLAGLFAGQSIDQNSLFAPAALQSQAGGAIRWRLFDFGRVDAEVAAARGKQAEALAAYRLTVLKATGEVENAFTDLAQQRAESGALSTEVSRLTAARGQTEQAYEEGVASLIEVRDVDRNLLTASDQLAQARTGEAKAAVEVFRALGGGWNAAALK
jgi:NodT family efflux transporter outer membrane factor (OMF) lipoprotein